MGGAALEVRSREPMQPTPPSESFIPLSQSGGVRSGGHLTDQFLDTVFITAQDFQV